MKIERTGVLFIVGFLLLALALPQSALADGPVISNVHAVDVTSTSARIVWRTDILSNSTVNYGVTTALGNTKSSGNVTTNHSIELTGLLPGTLYYYEVLSDGVRSPGDRTLYHSFQTPPLPSGYSITLEPACGVCGELIKIEEDKWVCGEVIKVTAVVAEPGTYYICWDAKTVANVVGTFTATRAGTHTLTFYMPEATKGPHTVYLVEGALYAERTKTDFTVYPFVKIDPERGPVGTRVSFNGYGFSNGQQIQIKFQDTIITATPLTANPKGSWNFSYIIPHTPGGGYVFEVQAKEGTDFWPFANKYFAVTPQISVKPDLGTVGQAIDISGTGFASKEGNIKVTFGEKVRKENIYADKDGSWSTSIAVPALRSGRYIIDASGASTRARDVPDVMFTLVPGISVNPGTGYVGDTITVAGGGFAPGEKGITVTFDGGPVASGISADINGCWESSFKLPVSTYGSHTVAASGETTKPAVTTTISTKARIEGISPTEGAPGDSVSIIGSGFHGSRRLTVTVGNATAKETLETQFNGNVAVSFRVPKGVTPGKQTLKVTDEGGATHSVDFTVTKKVLPTPLRILPEGDTFRSGIVTFRWQGIAGGSGITYIVEISKDSAFRSGVMSESAGTELKYTLPKEKALAKGTYYWRVKAVDDYGNESEFSATDYSTFTVSPIPTWVWVVVGLVVLLVLMVVAYRETKFKVAE